MFLSVQVTHLALCCLLSLLNHCTKSTRPCSKAARSAFPRDLMENTEINKGLNIKKVDNKANCEDIYTADSPMPYYKWVDAQNYGKSHDALRQFAHLAGDLADQCKLANRKVRLVDVGCSYGNTTLALVEKLDWKQVGAFWNDESMTMIHKNSYHVTACDISQNALNYGQKRGYYDDIFCQDVNEPLSERLKQRIIDADILSVYMVFVYFTGDSFQRLVDLFLSDRSRPKYIFYNWTPLFNKNLILTSTPDKFLRKHPQCSYQVEISQHRDLTEEEQRKLTLQGTLVGKESCNFIFGIKCNALETSGRCLL